MPRREGEVLRLGTAIEIELQSEAGGEARNKKARLLHAIGLERQSLDARLQADPSVSNAARAIASRGPRFAH